MYISHISYLIFDVMSCDLQCEAEEEPLLGSSCEDSLFSHKRSNSCSSADRLKIARVSAG